MRIVYFTHNFPPGFGVASLNAYKIAEHLSKLGNEITVFSPGTFSKKYDLGKNERTTDTNLQINYSSSKIKVPFNLTISHFENLIKFLIKKNSFLKPDLILSQYHAFHYASVVGNYASKILKVPHIIRSHDIFLPFEHLSSIYQFIYLMNYPQIFNSMIKSDIFYVVCSELRDYLLKIKKLKNNDIRVHHNGVDLDKFFPTNNQEELKEKYSCENIILFIGLLVPDVGLQDFIPLLPAILKDHKELKFLFIGEGPCKEYFMNYIKKNNINDKVLFLGLKPHNEMPFFINNCDFGIGRLTHKLMWKYSIPVKCLEYMSCKKSFITTPISKDVLNNNDVGITIKRSFTKSELINNIINLIEDKNLRSKLGENGLKKIYNNFQWESIMKDFNTEISNFKSKNN